MGKSNLTNIRRRNRCPSIRLRYEAIKIDWLKRWWHPKPDRADWTEIANELVFQSTRRKPEVS